jgi:hypothetical protein
VSIAIAAFAGWNDAGAAATDAVAYIGDRRDTEPVDKISSQRYCDFQINRPIVQNGPDGERRLIWPDTQILATGLEAEEQLVFVHGVEPARSWKRFCRELLEILEQLDVHRIILVGALLADVPHTRPATATATSSSARVREALDIGVNDYEGPTGIVGVLEHEANRQERFEALSVWAPVPHYVGASPSPRTELALVQRVTELAGITGLDTRELADEARAWTEGVDALAKEDPEIASYVESLESAMDTLASPAASGEALAKEFERYLRRRGQ